MADRLDKFSEPARQVLTLAQHEALRFGHHDIDTEHLLLGLIRERNGTACIVLEQLGVELDKLRSAVDFIAGRGEHTTMGEFRLTPGSQKAIVFAVEEARSLNANYIGTEHLLLGVIRDGDGVGAGVLESMGVSLLQVRAQTLRLLADGVSDLGAVPPEPSPKSDDPLLAGAQATLAALQQRTDQAISAREWDLAVHLQTAQRRLTEAIAAIAAALQARP